MATVHCRNWTCQDDVPIKKINDLMEAIHAIPEMMINWEHHDIDEIKLHLGCFDHNAWGDGPNLIGIFEDELTRNKNDDA